MPTIGPTLSDIFLQGEPFDEWRSYLDSIGPPPGGVSLPTGPDMQRTLRYLEVPEEDIPEIMRLTPTPQATPELWWVLERAVHSLVLHMGTIEKPPRFAALHDDVDPRFRFFYVHVFVAALPYTKAWFRQRRIPMDVQQAALADLGRNVRVHRKRTGEGGLGVSWWLMLHFRGMIYQLGRLQFERAHLGETGAISMAEAGIPASSESPVLSIHIPDFLGPMTPEACDASIRKARGFFETYFPEEPVLAGVCHSWLLDPQLKDYLRPDANIIQFQDRFHLVPGAVNTNDSILRFVFGTMHAEFEAYPQRTSLERTVISHLKAGKDWEGRFGWFAW